MTHLDIVPTLLDWLGLSYPQYHIFKNDGRVKLTGKSLLELLQPEDEMKARVRYLDILLAQLTSSKAHKLNCFRMFSSVRTFTRLPCIIQ